MIWYYIILYCINIYIYIYIITYIYIYIYICILCYIIWYDSEMILPVWHTASLCVRLTSLRTSPSPTTAWEIKSLMSRLCVKQRVVRSSLDRSMSSNMEIENNTGTTMGYTLKGCQWILMFIQLSSNTAGNVPEQLINGGFVREAIIGDRILRCRWGSLNWC